MALREQPLSEGITRLSIAHDLALTGSIQSELTNREQRCLSIALEMLQEVTSAHGEPRLREPDKYPSMYNAELEHFIAHLLVMRYGHKDLKFSALRENLPMAIVEQLDKIALQDEPELFNQEERS